MGSGISMLFSLNPLYSKQSPKGSQPKGLDAIGKQPTSLSSTKARPTDGLKGDCIALYKEKETQLPRA